MKAQEHTQIMYYDLICCMYRSK